MVFKTNGTCSRAIEFDIKDNKVYNVKFIGGCPGNTNGVSKLVEGMEINEVINKLKGIPCRFGTSCPDQLAQALELYLQQNK